MELVLRSDHSLPQPSPAAMWLIVIVSPMAVAAFRRKAPLPVVLPRLKWPRPHNYCASRSGSAQGQWPTWRGDLLLAYRLPGNRLATIEKRRVAMNGSLWLTGYFVPVAYPLPFVTDARPQCGELGVGIVE